MELMSIEQLGATARLMGTPIFLSFVGLVVLVSDLIFNREDERRWPAYLSVAGLIGSLFLWVQSWLLFHPATDDNAFFGLIRNLLQVGTLQDADLAQAQSLFGGMFNAIGLNNFTLLATLLIIVSTLIVTLISPAHLERRGLLRGEFYALMIFAAVGGILMAGSANLIMVFLGVELLSIPLYILAGFARPQLRSQESALKYFLLGAFASGFLLYGIALTYGATGTMSIEQILNTLQTDMGIMGQTGQGSIAFVGETPNWMLFAGMVLLIIGLAFKISLVPFHQWTPDVYEGAPTPVTAFMVSVTKIAGFAVLTNVMIGFYSLGEWWSPLFAIISLLTMIVGNVGAIRQTNIKRMLAYSSIAHAGYMMVGMAGFQNGGLVSPLIFYLAIYALTNLGTFAVLMALEEVTGKERLELEDFKGLGKEQPFLGVLMAFFLLSLAGFPPTAGFFAKFYLFSGALIADQLWLIVAAVLLSVISLVYYARYLIAMFMESPDPAAVTETPTEALTAETVVELDEEGEPVMVAPQPAPRPAIWMVQTALVVTTVIMIIVALFPGALLDLL
jgi:NADH-quinone oxidoreductase subunit N